MEENKYKKLYQHLLTKQ